jgi:hypothetical protein
VRAVTYESITHGKFPHFYWHDIFFPAKLLAAHNKGTSRARSLEELHDKLQALRGEMSRFKTLFVKINVGTVLQ